MICDIVTFSTDVCLCNHSFTHLLAHSFFHFQSIIITLCQTIGLKSPLPSPTTSAHLSWAGRKERGRVMWRWRSGINSFCPSEVEAADERSKKEEKGVLVFRWPRRQLSLIFEARSPKKTFRGILVSQFMRFPLILLHHEIIQLQDSLLGWGKLHSILNSDWI